MEKIDEYIEQAKNMPNTSEGGSAAYSFDDVVLVKYSIHLKYGDQARPEEELVALKANELNNKGINTPKHLAIKRTVEGENAICWVLQEKAKGVNFNNYTYGHVHNPQQQLILQEELLNAPLSHYGKCLTDLIALFNMGIELKPKNIFYDKNEAGGFTFIDLLGYDNTPCNLNSIAEILRLDNYMSFICQLTLIPSYSKAATELEKAQSLEYFYRIKAKIFITMERIIPNFNQYKKWILRTYSTPILNYFRKIGILKEDLALDDEDYKQFENYVNLLVKTCLKKVESGELEYFQVQVNEIRIMITEMGLRGAWNFHRLKQEINPEDYEDKWDYEYASNKYLDDLVLKQFDKELAELAATSTNEKILNAYNISQNRPKK